MQRLPCLSRLPCIPPRLWPLDPALVALPARCCRERAGGDAGRVPVHAHLAAEGLEPEWVGHSAQKLITAMLHADGFHDHRASSSHAVGQPGGDVASVEGEIGAVCATRHGETPSDCTPAAKACMRSRSECASLLGSRGAAQPRAVPRLSSATAKAQFHVTPTADQTALDDCPARRTPVERQHMYLVRAAPPRSGRAPHAWPAYSPRWVRDTRVRCAHHTWSEA